MIDNVHIWFSPPYWPTNTRSSMPLMSGSRLSKIASLPETHHDKISFLLDSAPDKAQNGFYHLQSKRQSNF